jgi:hypothetical protein
LIAFDRIGLTRQPCMPASRKASRSWGNAWAVSAKIGTSRERAVAEVRTRRVASTPSSPGMEMSSSMTSKAVCSACRKSVFAVDGEGHLAPLVLEHLARQDRSAPRDGCASAARSPGTKGPSVAGCDAFCKVAPRIRDLQTSHPANQQHADEQLAKDRPPAIVRIVSKK